MPSISHYVFPIIKHSTDAMLRFYPRPHQYRVCQAFNCLDSQQTWLHETLQSPSSLRRMVIGQNIGGVGSKFENPSSLSNSTLLRKIDPKIPDMGKSTNWKHSRCREVYRDFLRMIGSWPS